MNLAEVLSGPASTDLDAPALVEGDVTVSHGALAQRAARFAGRLIESGVAEGDRVALCTPNGVGFVVAYLGILRAGGVAVPLNPLAPDAELHRELDAVGARVLVAATATGAPVRILDVPDEPDALGGEEPVAMRAREPEDPAALLFTSGTAGPPKAAILTHGSLSANLHQIQGHPGLALAPDDVVLGALPFFHVFGLNVSLGLALAAGSSLVVVGAFDAATIGVITARQVTVVAGVPGMYHAWLDDESVSASSFDSVRLAVSGAAALGEDVATGFRDRFGVVIHQGYGLTEASPVVTTTALTPEPRPGSIGPPLPGVEVRLVDDDGGDVLVGDPGEIWVRGPNVFAGYWNDAAATARVLTPDGWLRTGDVAIVDDDGELSLVDRSKDLIIVSGFNVYPAEVEEVIGDDDRVAEVAVVGEPDDRTGEAVVAYVVPAPGAQLDAAELRAVTGARLARYKCPSRVEMVEELPRTAIGKVLRRELRGDPPTS